MLTIKSNVYLDGEAGRAFYRKKDGATLNNVMQDLLTSLSYTLDADVNANYWEIVIGDAIEEALNDEMDELKAKGVGTFDEAKVKLVNVNGTPTLAVYMDYLFGCSQIDGEYETIQYLGNALIDNLMVSIQDDGSGRPSKLINFNAYTDEELDAIDKECFAVDESAYNLGRNMISRAIAMATAD